MKTNTTPNCTNLIKVMCIPLQHEIEVLNKSICYEIKKQISYYIIYLLSENKLLKNLTI